MKSKWWILGLALPWVAACQRGPREIKIALALPLTGDIASVGQGIQRSATLALEEATTAGRFKSPVVLVPFDDRSDPKEAVNVANRVVSDPDRSSKGTKTTGDLNRPAVVASSRARVADR
jgi:ABC-type branched-subunit amino acid transport system substrate-binding protein